jgi:hypothetical protein
LRPPIASSWRRLQEWPPHRWYLPSRLEAANNSERRRPPDGVAELADGARFCARVGSGRFEPSRPAASTRGGSRPLLLTETTSSAYGRPWPRCCSADRRTANSGRLHHCGQRRSAHTAAAAQCAWLWPKRILRFVSARDQGQRTLSLRGFCARSLYYQELAKLARNECPNSICRFNPINVGFCKLIHIASSSIDLVLMMLEHIAV